jgi:methylation protein EvaC
VRIGSFRRRTICRLCGSTRLTEVLDFGYVPLAGGFLRRDQLSHEYYYPLQLHFCQDCYLLQVLTIISPRRLFSNYFYHSSSISTLVNHFNEMAKELKNTYLHDPKSLAVEVGSNDGVLLKPLAKLGAECIGIEPAANLARIARLSGSRVINRFFSKEVATHVRNEYGGADVVVFCNSFAHIDDMVSVMKGVKALLKPDGVLIIEVHYVGALINDLNYDMIYHEHLNYYSLLSLVTFFRKFGMEVFNVKKIPIHAGSIRCYVRNWDPRRESVAAAVNLLLESEKKSRLDRVERFAEFGAQVDKSRQGLVSLLKRLKDDRRKVVGYGASGRATTIMNLCGIDNSLLDFVVDDSSAKQGYFTPGSHLQIKSWSAARHLKPDYVLLFAWSYIDEILRKRSAFIRSGGKFIIPLPQIRVVP